MRVFSKDSIDHRILEASLLRVGEVIEVRGRMVKVLVDKLKNGAILNYKGDSIRNASVGSYVIIMKGFCQIVGSVSGEYVSSDRTVNEAYHRKGDGIQRILDVSVIGYIETGEFCNGIRELPLIGSSCRLATKEEINSTVLQHSSNNIPIGHLTSNPEQNIDINPNDVMTSHIGIFGNTGSGKSYTLAKLYSELFYRYKYCNGFTLNSRFIIIDFNGEYSDEEIITDKSLKKSYILSTKKQSGQDKLPLPSKVMHDAQLWKIFLDATEKTQSPFLNRVFRRNETKALFDGKLDIMQFIFEMIKNATISFDKTMDKNIVSNFLHEIANYVASSSRNAIYALQESAERLYYHSNSNCFYITSDQGIDYSNNDINKWIAALESLFMPNKYTIECESGGIDAIGAAIVFSYYTECIRGFSNSEHLAPLIKRLNSRIGDIKKVVRIDDQSFFENTLTIVSFKDTNLDVRKILPMLICSFAYEQAKESDEFRYLNIIIDEAHNILSSESNRESEQWKSYRLETFEEIIKEGRKFGVFLTIASQRPFDISPTIISQLHNYFIHRLVNEKDLRAIENAVSYIDELSFGSIPVLATGSCIASGTAFNRPLMIDVSAIRHGNPPSSQTIDVEELWITDELLS